MTPPHRLKSGFSEAERATDSLFKHACADAAVGYGVRCCISAFLQPEVLVYMGSMQ